MGTNAMYVHPMGHAATCTCTYVSAVKGENQSRGNSTCMKSCQRNTVSFTQCVHVHKSVRVTVRACSHILRPNFANLWYN